MPLSRDGLSREVERESDSQMMRDRASYAIELAQRLGADQSEVGVSMDAGINVTVRMGNLESVERQKNRGIGITVYRKHCKGSASTTDFSEQGVEAAVRKALSIARFTAADEYSGLADPELMASHLPDLDLYHPWEIDVDSATNLALSVENAARDVDPRIENSEGATVASGSAARFYANSHGFGGGYPSSSHSLSCSVVAGADGQLERDYWVTSSRVPQDLEIAENVGKTAAERALRRLGSRQIRTQMLPVLYPPELARGLFGHLVSAISGTSQYRRASFLLGAAGTKVFSSLVNIEEDPHIPRAMGSTAFDGDGVATQRRVLVDDGILQGYVLSAYSARRLGLRTTANAGGIHNLIVAPTAGLAADILKEFDEVFVIGELLGQGVNTVTGDYSRGAAGFLVRRGEVVHPVSEVTVAGNLSGMFERILAVGSDVDQRGVIRCGSVLIDQMTVAGQ